MDHFEYRDGKLYCEDVSVADIAASAGTPVYIYSSATLLHHYNSFAQAFPDTMVCFAVKALSNLNVLRLLSEAGCGFDVVSGGELARVLAAGGDPSKVVFAGVGKKDQEIREALEAGIGLFSVESEPEFANISRIAAEMGCKTRASLRINPDVYDPKTHSYTATGRKESKFGVDINRAPEFFATWGRDPNVTLDAISLHIGSPIYSAGPYVDAINKTFGLIDALQASGLEIRLLDIGGGYAADYEAGASPKAAEYAAEILPLLASRNLETIIEPGRQIACNAGILLCEVQYIKHGADREFMIVDAAMTDLLRPALYGAEHFMYPTALADGEDAPQRKTDFSPPNAICVDVVGGVCESSDFLAKGRMLPKMSRGDLLAVFSAGAYGFVMASPYNSRPRAAEVLVDGDTWRIIRPRETYDDLFASEK